MSPNVLFLSIQRKHSILLNGSTHLLCWTSSVLVQTLLYWSSYSICTPEPKFVLTPISRPFNLHCGTRQGCPLSPMLFDMAVEPLATALHSCKTVLTVTSPDTRYKVSLYADDLLLLISYPMASLPPVLMLLSQFGKLSGYKLNLNKSELFPINNEACALYLTSLPFKIENNKFSYFGISVTGKHKDISQENLITLLNQTKQTLTQWSPMSMSLVGCINSVKMPILPKFLYLFQEFTTLYPRIPFSASRFSYFFILMAG